LTTTAAWSGRRPCWQLAPPALSPSFTVITVDLRGFGNTRWESDHDARSFPGDIIAVLDAVAVSGGPRKAVLVGQSIGAAAPCGRPCCVPTGPPAWCWRTRWAGCEIPSSLP
jgi:predicted alpha/beta hydrolase